MDFGLKGKVALITGASRGLGKASALMLAREGCSLVICARGKDVLKQTADELRTQEVEGKVHTVVCDMASATGPQAVFDAAIEAFGTVDILVNNVGVAISGDILTLTDADWQGNFDLNVFGAIRLCRLTVPVMRNRGWGRIINIASIWGRERGGTLSYQTTKSAVISFSKALAIEEAPYGITVNSVAPGSIFFLGGPWDQRKQEDPEYVELVRKGIALGRFGKPEEIASVVAFLASQQASLLTGACINVDGGQTYSII